MRAIRATIIVGLLLALSTMPALAQAVDASLACGAAPELLEAGTPLPATARAVQRGQLKVLVVGSASVFGPGTSAPDQAWPQRMQALLQRRLPGLDVQLTVRGGRGLTAADAGGLLAAELPALKPSLVLWQAGTVETVRGHEPERLTEALEAGIAKVTATGADLVLLDQQFSRFLRANTNIDVYRDAIRLIAAAHGLPVLRRYELMRFWAETDRIDLERAPREMRVVVADRLNACLAGAMTALLLDGIAEAKGKARP